MTKTRRGHGEGSWTKIGSNKWKLTITIGTDINGKQIRRSKTGTKQECQQWYKENQATSCNSYFYDYAMNWLELRKFEITESTYRGILLRIKRIAKINNFKISNVDDKILSSIIEEIAKTQKPRSTNAYLSTLKQIFTYAYSNGHVKKIPYLPRLKQRVSSPDITILSFEEIKKLLLTARFSKKGNFYALLLMIFSCGLRLGEAMGLTKDDINLDNSTVTINKICTIDHKGTPCVRQGAKTLTSNRTIYVNRQVLEEVLKYSNPYNKYIFMHGEGITSVASISLGIVSFFKKYGYNLSAHKIRHIFITLTQQQQGLSLPFIATYAGHTLSLVTFNTYTHIKIDAKNTKLDDYVSHFIDF